MPELFVYDASEVNREPSLGERYNSSSNNFRGAIALLRPPIPFLIRTIIGDARYDDSIRKFIIKNSFKNGNRTLSQILSDILNNGSDRTSESEDPCNTRVYAKNLPEDCLPCDIIWAFHERHPHIASHYVFGDDGNPPYNHLSMILDARFYHQTQNRSIFYQQDIELRKKALLGIIIDDTNPNKPKLQPLRFTLTPENLEQIVAEIQRTGYFAEP